MINRKKFLQGFEIERTQNDLARKNKNEWEEEKWDQENVKDEKRKTLIGGKEMK